MRRPNEPDVLMFRKSLFQDRRLFKSEGATSVYCLLAFMADDTGRVNTSIAELIEDLGTTKEVLEEALGLLVELDLITPQPGRDAAGESVLRYRLRIGVDYLKSSEEGVL